ncbi:phosphodiester glycosidase family protein, partial [Leptolyngbya sp. FACHB-36]|uniref:phosphodiester glycosidase family protein n=1 Tax=Leptolyngbya sp. FACHB-36 TaxID=2692808 RepID=UPI0016815E0C
MASKNWQRYGWWAIGFGVLLLPLLLYAMPHFLRPPRVEAARSLFPGITYQRQVRSVPRPMMIHIVAINLTAPGIGVLATPGQATPDETETTARTTSEFLTEFKLQLAINANFFHPFHEENFWNYYPRSGDRVNLLGLGISNGAAYSTGWSNWAALCFGADRRARIEETGKCPSGTVQAVAGKQLLVAGGKPTSKSASSTVKSYPRVAAAVDAAGQRLWLIAIDGKQPHYSEGGTLAELAEIVVQLGADKAVNLDGGGSTTIVVSSPTGPYALNAPIHTKIP